MARITKKDLGKSVVFVGFDNQVYKATIDSIRRGIIEISYPHPSYRIGGRVVARLDRASAKERLVLV